MIRGRGEQGNKLMYSTLLYGILGELHDFSSFIEHISSFPFFLFFFLFHSPTFSANTFLLYILEFRRFI